MHKIKKIANDKSPKIVIRSTHFLSPKSETLVPTLRSQGFFYNLTGQETKKNNDRKITAQSSRGVNLRVMQRMLGDLKNNPNSITSCWIVYVTQ